LAAFKYRAFLSYSHADMSWAKWLHKTVEGYLVDKDMVGRETAYGPVPKTLRPVFRDRDDFPAGHNLTEQTLAALKASQFLIVICSPRATQSLYVNEEIRRFKSLGRAANVIPVIVEGEPGDPRRECFPPALRFKLGAGGGITEEREEPIAADARPDKDGKETAKLKVVAALLGVGLDEIVRRAERARKRRNLICFGAVLGVIVLISATVLGWTGLEMFFGRLRAANDLNGARDAADLCEDAGNVIAANEVPETERVTIAYECVSTFAVVLDGHSRDMHLPPRVISMFRNNLAELRRYGDEGKLTAEQSAALTDAEALAKQIGQ
jgi:hypothetical protein